MTARRKVDLWRNKQKSKKLFRILKHSSGLALGSVRCLLFANCEVKSHCVVHTWAHDSCAFIAPVSLIRNWGYQDFWLKIFFVDTCCE